MTMEVICYQLVLASVKQRPNLKHPALTRRCCVLDGILMMCLKQLNVSK